MVFTVQLKLHSAFTGGWMLSMLALAAQACWLPETWATKPQAGEPDN